jgi:DNA uptake protein ComE-like DNA-binding protein
MHNLLNTLFDFHPKEQKGILTLGIILLLITIGHAVHRRLMAPPDMESQLTHHTVDSLHAVYQRFAIAGTNTSFYTGDDQSVGEKEFDNAELMHPSESANTEYVDQEVPNKWKKPNYATELDINVADSLQWISVRGIGPYTAKKIMSYREKLGGFHCTEQLREIYKIDPIVFDTCGTQFHCRSASIRRININTCDAMELASHPYLNKSQAKSIIAYREMHGLYPSLQTLEHVKLLDAITLSKITPYLSIE